jgi:anion-transporting  ArsA/GET3 family ATPase
VSAASSLRDLILTRRVLVAVGAGGVGKTTTAAALSIAAAQAGRRVLCLTIDPARRLALSLGLQQMTTDVATVDPRPFEAAGAPLEAAVTVMVLDTRRTFDDIVVRYSSSPEKARQLLDNRLYQYVATSLAGTQEYMAMEKLASVRDDPAYDLVILDTPPTANAIDFLDAPKRMVLALDSTTIRWFSEAFQATGKLSLNLLARSAARALRGLGRITGGGFMRAMAELITELNDLFGGFRSRAMRIEGTLRSSEVGFVLVTSPSPPAIDETLFLSDRLAATGIPRGAMVVNRVRTPPPALDGVDARAVDGALGSARAGLGAGIAERLMRAHADARQVAELDARSIARLLERVGDGVPIVTLPEIPSDICDARALARLAATLVR